MSQVVIESYFKDQEVPKIAPPEIEQYQMFAEADYTVLDWPEAFKESMTNVAMFMNARYAGQEIQLVGIGTSGAMVMVLLQHYMMFLPMSGPPVRVKGIIVRKPGEDTHRGTISRGWWPVPTIVVDDHIASGRTIRELSEILKKETDVYDGKMVRLIDYVEAIVAEKSYRLINQADNIYEYYPKLKYLIK